MVNFTDFCRIYAERYSVKYKTAKEICLSVFENLGKLIYEEQEEVELKGFFSLKHRKIPSRKYIHPVTKEICVSEEKKGIKFYPSRTFKSFDADKEDDEPEEIFYEED